mgnify:CR=1 FL=1
MILVSGIVQGVFYRNHANQKARKLGITGFVKNEPDGRVLVVAEGKEEKLKELIEWTKRGPLLAKIEKIEVEWDKAKGEFIDFKILY